MSSTIFAPFALGDALASSRECVDVDVIVANTGWTSARKLRSAASRRLSATAGEIYASSAITGA